MSRIIGSMMLSIVLVTLVGCASQPATNSYRPQPAPSTFERQQERHRIVTLAESMLGTPYRYGGTSPRGFDCSGLVFYTHRQAGLNPPRTTLAQFRHSQPVAIKHLQPGDLLFFKLTGAKTSHVGIYIGKGKFIHAPSSGKVVSRSTLDNPYWQQHLIGAGTFL